VLIMKNIYRVIVSVLIITIVLLITVRTGYTGNGSIGQIYKTGDTEMKNVNTKIIESETYWKNKLSEEQFNVLRKKGTERAYTGKYYNFHKDGTYSCAGCGAELFSSTKKYDSGSGWPSFYDLANDKSVVKKRDTAYGMERNEILCATCGGHLGHVFNDGPKPTGLRYCVNSAALDFKENVECTQKTEKAVFAAGCFWGVEQKFSQVPGVVKTVVGYTGGKTVDPTYEDVCTDKTGHAEAVLVEYDPGKVSYTQLLETFWKLHNPTTLDQQGVDVGTQYRSAIYYHSDSQQRMAVESKSALEKTGKYKNKIVTEIVLAGTFYPAEEYHQKYYQKKGLSGGCGIK